MGRTEVPQAVLRKSSSPSFQKARKMTPIEKAELTKKKRKTLIEMKKDE